MKYVLKTTTYVVQVGYVAQFRLNGGIQVWGLLVDSTPHLAPTRGGTRDRAALHYAALHYAALHCAALHYAALHYAALHYAAQLLILVRKSHVPL